MVECIADYRNTSEFSLYRYDPSVAAAVIFAILFAITSILHLVQMYKTKTWYLTALIVGGFFQFIGYAARAKNASEKAGCWSLTPYIIQTLLVLIAPALFAASIYMILGRIILLTDGEAHSLIPQRWLTKSFVTGDVISFFMQVGGGSMLSSKDEGVIKSGEKLVIAGLFVQLAYFGFFIAVALVFHRRMLAKPTSSSLRADIHWKKYLTTLYVTSVLILIRSVFRVIEYLQGNNGSLLRKEIYLYIFDSVLMFLVLAWMNWFHPSEIGLLLRGEQTFDNGIELIGIKVFSESK
ncbi:RTA1 like protein-domain-containing protein [Bisporella sp. PMI_857]|nr:RTA1 like protein-domain-containing protein [Bisporella sp. PMI_857]